MKIAIITSGRLPVPATKGGAVETKLEYLLYYNATHHLHDITVYSIKPDKIMGNSAKENHYVHFDMESLYSKIGKHIYSYINDSHYYTEEIDFFLYRCLKDIKKKHFNCIIIANRPGFILKLRKAVNTFIVNQINNDYINPNSLFANEIKEASSLIITCSNFLNRQTSKVECHKEIPIITVHNGIDIKRFYNAHPLDRSFIGISNEDFIVFYSGRLTKEKGILELLQAIKCIDSISNIKLIIAGSSFYGKDCEITSYVKLLRKEAEPIKDKVIFTGFVDYTLMPSYLKIANVIVVPSLWEEPFGLTVLEAMASGVPLIATRCGGIPEVCDDTALLIERENICMNIAKAIQHVFDNPGEAKLMAQKAEERSWLFDKDVFSKNYFNAIKKIYQANE